MASLRTGTVSYDAEYCRNTLKQDTAGTSTLLTNTNNFTQQN